MTAAVSGWRILLSTLVALAPALANATGWNDYTLEIAPGFTVFRANTFEVCLGASDNRLLVCPSMYSDHPIGPLAEYALTPEFVFTRHHGSEPHDGNPALRQADPDVSFFFRVDRTDRSVLGPISRASWDAHFEPRLSELEWKAPRNPNFWLPLLGSLAFLLFSVVYLAYLAWPLLLALAIAVAARIYWRRRSSAAA